MSFGLYIKPKVIEPIEMACIRSGFDKLSHRPRLHEDRPKGSLPVQFRWFTKNKEIKERDRPNLAPK